MRMKQIQRGILILVFLCAVTMLAACSKAGNSPDSNSNQPSNPDQVTPASKVLDGGEIVSKEENQLLITKYVEGTDGPYVEALSFTINDETEFLDSGGQPVASEQFTIGTKVEAWSSSPIMESYPGQTTAAKIIMHDDTMDVPDNIIERAAAIQAALKPQTELSAANAIKSTTLDEEAGHWQIELVNHEFIDQPIIVYVDANTGQIVSAPVAENDAFRVFSPSSGTEASPNFTVEGEARVFEAAFSWELEDGHTIFAEGHLMADKGAPDWGHFQFDVNYEKASQPNMMLILYVNSAKDGSREHQLVIPLKVPEQYIDYNVE